MRVILILAGLAILTSAAYAADSPFDCGWSDESANVPVVPARLNPNPTWPPQNYGRITSYLDTTIGTGYYIDSPNSPQGQDIFLFDFGSDGSYEEIATGFEGYSRVYIESLAGQETNPCEGR